MWNVHAHWDCRYDTDNSHARVPVLEVSPYIYRDGDLAGVGSPTNKWAYNVYSLDHNAAARCNLLDVFALWQGKADGFVQFPDGYTPPNGSLHVESPEVEQEDHCLPNNLPAYRHDNAHA